jgi:hypothetical protein
VARVLGVDERGWQRNAAAEVIWGMVEGGGPPLHSFCGLDVLLCKPLPCRERER